MMNISSLPCRDCITLPMCIQRYNTEEKFKLDVLITFCSLMENYLFSPDLSRVSQKGKETREFFENILKGKNEDSMQELHYSTYV